LAFTTKKNEHHKSPLLLFYFAVIFLDLKIINNSQHLCQIVKMVKMFKDKFTTRTSLQTNNQVGKNVALERAYEQKLRLPQEQG
jgi:flagellar biosynthesis regulator FlbT